MSLWSGLKAALSSGAKEINKEYGKTEHFLISVCAAVTLVIYADGVVEDSEKKGAMTVLCEHEQLSKLYPRATIEQAFNSAMTHGSSSSGRNSLGRKLDDVRALPNGAVMADDVYLMAFDVAHTNSRGDVGDKEKAVLEKIAQHLNVDPSKFEF